MSSIVDAYYEWAPEDREENPADDHLPRHIQRFNVWVGKYQRLHDRFAVVKQETGDTNDALVERSLEQLLMLTSWLVSDVQIFLEAPAEPGSEAFRKFNDRFVALHVAIADRISLLEAELDRPIRPK